MKRRSVLKAAALCGPIAVRAQGSDKRWRIAFLAAGGQPRAGQFSPFDAIMAGLRERGFSALQTQAWYTDSRADALPALAQQVLAWQPDVIAAHLTPAAVAASRATRSVPIVMAGSVRRRGVPLRCVSEVTQ